MRRVLLLILLSLPTVLPAQNQLVPASDAVQLRRVWTQQGESLSADEYGYNVWGGTDITGDSIADFAVNRRADNTWLFYRGGNPPETIPFLEIDSAGSVPPYIANFYGDDRRFALFRSGYREDIDDYSYFYDILRLHELDNGTIERESFVSVNHGEKEPPVERAINEILVHDINDDELSDVIVVMNGVRIGQDRFTFDGTRQVWIYFGGADFQLETPDVIVRDSGLFGNPDNWQVRFADIDGDGRTDMVMGGSYPTGGRLLRFYWGDQNSPQSWAERPPDRDVQLLNGQTGIASSFNLGLYQLDAHPGVDIVGYTGNEADGTYIYLSSRGNPRTRSFLTGDADLVYLGTALATQNVGFLNDSLRRYEMIPVGATIAGDPIAHAFISGGSDGPDHDYEAWYAPELDGLDNAEYIFQRGSAVGDVTGDGFGDVLYSDWRYGSFTNAGIAFLLAGGPQIPLDDPSTVVEEYPVAGESSGLYLWPNPAVDELHIAWRGNLKSKPARLAIYTVRGEMVVEGVVDPYRGEMIWQCGGVAPGAYLLVAYDTNDNPIADARITKRHIG